MGIQVVHPVKHVSGIRYDGNETQDNGGNFRQALEKAENKQSEKEHQAKLPPGKALEMMAGMNQYDRNAKEIFFAMTSSADYKC